MAKLSELLQAQQDQADMLRKITELPGLNRAAAQAATLQKQPMVPTGMLAPADQTPFGEMRQLSPQELAAKNAVTVPVDTFSNPNLRGSHIDRVVPYYAAKNAQEGGLNVSPELIKEYQRAGLTNIIAERGGNNPVIVEHEASHKDVRDELENRKEMWHKFAGKPEGAVAEAQYRLKQEQLNPTGNPFASALKEAGFPTVGNPKYGTAADIMQAYRDMQLQYPTKR